MDWIELLREDAAVGLAFLTTSATIVLWRTLQATREQCRSELAKARAEHIADLRQSILPMQEIVPLMRRLASVAGSGESSSHR